MALGKKLNDTMADAKLNKNIGTFSYWLHRLSGIGLAVYLLMHTYVLSSAITSPEAFSMRMSEVQNPLFAVLEVLLIAGVFIHMLNGLRITASDFLGWSRSHKALFWLVILLFIFFMILAVVLQWPKFNIDNYGVGG